MITYVNRRDIINMFRTLFDCNVWLPLHCLSVDCLQLFLHASVVFYHFCLALDCVYNS